MGMHGADCRRGCNFFPFFLGGGGGEGVLGGGGGVKIISLHSKRRL